MTGSDTGASRAWGTVLRSRRSMLAAAVGGIGAWVVGAAGRVSPVRAEGENVVVGGEYSASSVTKIANQTNAAAVFEGESASGTGMRGISNSATGVRGISTSGPGVAGNSTSGPGVAGATSGNGSGVEGFSPSGRGVHGQSGDGLGVDGLSQTGIGTRGHTNGTAAPGVLGSSNNGSTGVQGYSSNDSLPAKAPKANTGIYGYSASGSASRGVWGETTIGIGLFGLATTGHALRTSGRIKVDRVSGVATITAGNTSKTVTPGVNVTSDSFVLLTPKVNIGSRGMWFTTKASADTFTIRMSSSRSTGTKVAWLLLG